MIVSETNHRWDMEVTRLLVFQRYGVDQLLKIRPVLRAVRVRLVHAQIHYAEYLQLFGQNFANPLVEGIAAEDLLIGGFDDESMGATNAFFVRAEAHVYACLQAMHAVADNLAHVVYYALGWNLQNRLPARNASLNSVIDRLRADEAVTPSLHAILEPLDRLKSDPSFKLVADATNHIKHHGGLPISIGLGNDETQPLKAYISSFMRRGKHVDAQDVNLVLGQGFVTLNRVVVDVGCAINAVLDQAQNGA